MIEVKNLEQTCIACPSQWEFRTFDNRPVYVRYRWGNLSVRVGAKDAIMYDAVMYGHEVVREPIGDSFDGFIEWEDVVERLYPIQQDDLKEFLEEKGF